MTLPITDDGRPGAEVPVLNIANVLTVLRIVLVPVFVVLFFVADAQDPWWRVGAFVVFVFAMATDYVDGYLARRLGLVTDFGKIADPIADKALMAAAMISLSLVHELFWWVTIVILVREVGITLWRLFGVDHVVAASKGGKLKTVTQTLGLGMLILPLPHWVWPVEWAVIGVALVLTVYTGIDYLVKARQAARAGH
ncbi:MULTISPECIES: CDP-diacylglycerol--glycerol-3-phosphate 3-phosphatidyltransferase [Dietzia]|uniref:CDP-diacylglycerol--glycerol-3-phosphate 3-phosphatidyltransferase n=2 Tax=Dietzia TaxID=37914 RepID=A0ABN2I1I8_9ACTN|nr:CDP-diacylglycerol--glycerol-3-phosphate 3-phosphatidyltransferase [Dietzia cercidiphylli]MBB1050005.1 CDP-diacylglycerol--glycerol-3-phosphate 3-phosphatidyltransferase [Dietzia sp. CW19]MBB1053924.1 CDP-diacylglycerol--glycerol-3-phosphate 3-phosphatidyltransferase [Dietzia sp. B44]MBC7295100.1 CDP-diacylglycerol--glycerol-3-phosphate 3-phosphatidyltransferase [Dietzia sp.]MDZ4236302.1 CDP-diacylglycerol--glycerol-3-phosphate 3-phosphatidyltransferase [Dietzia sp.]